MSSKIIISLTTITLLISCASPLKQLAKGKYDQSINGCIKKLNKNATQEKYALCLEQAYNLAYKRDAETISIKLMANTIEDRVNILYLYNDLFLREKKIKHLLPISIESENRHANFSAVNLDDSLDLYKDNTINHLYFKSKPLIESQSLKSAREAYSMLELANNIKYGVDSIQEALKNAKLLGTIKVFTNFSVINSGNISDSVYTNLKDLKYSINNDEWIEYYINDENQIKYNYHLGVSISSINISDGEKKEEQIIERKEVNDGYEYELDNNGNVKKDSLGNDIKSPKTKTIYAELKKHNYNKEGKIGVNLRCTDYSNGKYIYSSSFSVKFSFNKEYLEFISGNTEALSQHTIEILEKQKKDHEDKTWLGKLMNPLGVPTFPTNDQMVMDNINSLISNINSAIERKSKKIREEVPNKIKLKKLKK